MAENNLRCLIFKYLHEPFGIDSEQISALVEIDDAPDIELSYFHELFYGQPGKAQYQKPMLLLIKDDGRRRGVVIECPENIVDVAIENIRPLPPLIASCSKKHPLWGVAVKGDEWFFLVDLYRFAFREVNKVCLQTN